MPRKGQIDWDKVVEKAEELALRYLRQYNSAPTLRALFYMLVSENLIPNTRNAYKRLSEKLAKLRYSGKFSWDLIKDETRPVYRLEPMEYGQTEPLSPEELRKYLEQFIESHFDVSVNPWIDQRWRIIIVLEKQALADSIRNAIQQAFQWGVYQLRVIRGYDSATDVKRLADDLSVLLLTHNVIIFILSDFDPSGEDLARDFEQRVRMLVQQELAQYGVKSNELRFEKIAITPQQIIQYDIPPAPESADELLKLRRDPRYKRFMERIRNDPLLKELVEVHGVVRAELDALLALRHDEFVKILRDAIMRYWDEKTFQEKTLPKLEEMKRKAEEAKRQSLENLKKLLGEEQ